MFNVNLPYIHVHITYSELFIRISACQPDRWSRLHVKVRHFFSSSGAKLSLNIKTSFLYIDLWYNILHINSTNRLVSVITILLFILHSVMIYTTLSYLMKLNIVPLKVSFVVNVLTCRRWYVIVTYGCCMNVPHTYRVSLIRNDRRETWRMHGLMHVYQGWSQHNLHMQHVQFF